MYIIYTCITLPKFNSSPSLPTTIFQGHEIRSYFDGPTSFPSNLHRLPLIRTHSNPTFVYKVLKKSFSVILNNFKLYTIIYMLYIYRIYPMFLSIQMYIYIYIDINHFHPTCWERILNPQSPPTGAEVLKRKLTTSHQFLVFAT